MAAMKNSHGIALSTEAQPVSCKYSDIPLPGGDEGEGGLGGLWCIYINSALKEYQECMRTNATP